MSGNRNRFKVGQAEIGAAQGFVNDGQYSFEVCSRRDLGNNSTEPFVQFVLGGDNAGEDSTIAIDDGSSRFIAGRFDRQKEFSRLRFDRFGH
jgi:hypothetical protein